MAFEEFEQRNRKEGYPVTAGSPRLENWFRIGDILYGEVYGHERFPDGYYIRTSLIMEMNEEEGWAKTLNTRYTLGVARNSSE